MSPYAGEGVQGVFVTHQPKKTFISLYFIKSLKKRIIHLKQLVINLIALLFSPTLHYSELRAVYIQYKEYLLSAVMRLISQPHLYNGEGSHLDKETESQPPGQRWWSNLLGKLNRWGQRRHQYFAICDHRKTFHVMERILIVRTGVEKFKSSTFYFTQGPHQPPFEIKCLLTRVTAANILFSPCPIKYRCRECRAPGKILEFYSSISRAGCVARHGPSY